MRRRAQLLTLLIAVYFPVVVVGLWFTMKLDIGAGLGSDASTDVLSRGTALSPPLSLVAVLVGGVLIAQVKGRVGACGWAMVGLSGVGLVFAGAVALPGHVAVAETLGASKAATMALGSLTALFGLAFGLLSGRAMAEALPISKGRVTGPRRATADAPTEWRDRAEGALAS